MKLKILLFSGIVVIIHTIIMIIIGLSLNFGTVLPLVYGFLAIMFYFAARTRKFKENEKVINRLVFYVKIVSVIWLISFIIVLVILVKASISDNVKKADCILVLGGGIKNGRPSKTLKARLDVAVKEHNKYPQLDIYVSGGFDMGETISEARAMKEYLVKKGIRKNQIIMEEKATSTFENMQFVKDILDKKYGEQEIKIILITNDFHMYRSRMLAKRADLNVYGVSARSFWYMSPNIYIREYLAFFKSVIIDRN